MEVPLGVLWDSCLGVEGVAASSEGLLMFY